MKLSVIIPVYKAEAYLETCVDSLLAQTLGDLEILLVDDGSPDRSGEIADRYAERYPEKIKSLHVENGGQGRARNIALPYAKGDFLGFVDSDDWVEPDMYEKLCARCEQTGADIAVCDWREVFPDGRERRIPSRFQNQRLAAAGSACNKVFRHTLLGDTRFPEGLWYEDFYFSAMLMEKAGRIEYLDEALYCYRQSPESTMRNNNAAKNLDLLEILDRMEKPLLDNEQRGDFEYLVLNHVLLDAINRVGRQQAPDRVQTLEALRRYAREKIPNLGRCASYRAEARNRRIIMRLNYLGLWDLSRQLLDFKEGLRR